MVTLVTAGSIYRIPMLIAPVERLIRAIVPRCDDEMPNRGGSCLSEAVPTMLGLVPSPRFWCFQSLPHRNRQWISHLWAAEPTREFEVDATAPRICTAALVYVHAPARLTPNKRLIVLAGGSRPIY